MFQAATGKKISGTDQRLDDAVIGITLLAFVVDHAGSTTFGIGSKTGCVIGVEAGIINRERDSCFKNSFKLLFPAVIFFYAKNFID